MVFCNRNYWRVKEHYIGHNPYFNRWFSAIENVNTYLFTNKSHNPYFNRWFSAMELELELEELEA